MDDTLSKSSSHPTTSMKKIKKKEEPSLCSPIGYFKNAYQDFCIHSDHIDADAFDVVKLGRCNKKREQQWAFNGSRICHPAKDKCLTVVQVKDQHFAVGTLPYDAGIADAQGWKLNKETSMIESKIIIQPKRQPWCMGVHSAAIDPVSGYSVISPHVCNKNERSQHWTFTSLTDTDNNPRECGRFQEKLGTDPSYGKIPNLTVY